jgi:hypothetical protein
MNKEFVTYEQALSLKELGFDEPCFGYYNIDPQLKNPAFNMVKPFEHIWCLPAPLYQQAFRWFREKHSLQHEIVYDISDDLTNRVYVYTVFGTDRSEEYKTYEEAESACLDKLIEICKTK